MIMTDSEIVFEAERVIEALSYSKKENRSDYESDEAFANFREVCVGNIKPKKLFRSSSPLLCDERSVCAAKLIKNAEIKTILNLCDDEKSAEKNLDLFPYYKSLAENGNVLFLNLDMNFSSKRFLKNLRKIFDFLASKKSSPILIHCAEGKDRTGFVCAILEALCEARFSEIIDDYMKSFENYFGLQKKSEIYNLVVSEIVVFLKRFVGVRRYEKLFESIESFLQMKANLDSQKINYVKNLFCLESHI